jgi:hypothetical protein
MIEQHNTDKQLQEQAAAARAQQRAADAAAIVAAPTLTSEQVTQLESKEGLTPEESRSLQRFYLQEFYCLPNLSDLDVIWDNEGRRRGEILNLEAMLYPQVGIDRTVKALQQQISWNQSICPWDIAHTVLRQTVRDYIGLVELFERARQGWEWTVYDLKPYADRIRAAAPQIKQMLHQTVHNRMSDVQVVHQLLAQLGLKLRFRWSRSVEGHEGKKLRVYSLDLEHWQQLHEVIERRARRRDNHDPQSASDAPESASNGSPVSFNQIITAGDPAPLELPAWEDSTATQRSAAGLCLTLVKAPEQVRPLLQSWAVEQRLSVIDWLERQQPVWMRQLLEAVPDLFAWCAGAD